MAIQFQCPSCSQPIEVDDEFAGQPAACPYCRRVVSVPEKTTLAPAGAVVARPLPPESNSGSVVPGAAPDHSQAAPPDRPVWRNYGAMPPALPADPVTPQRPDAVVENERLARQRALTYGTYSMIAGGIALLLLGLMLFQYGKIVWPRYAALATQPGGPPPDQVPKIEELQKLVDSVPGAAGRMTAFFWGSGFFSVVALAFAAASLRSQMNWRGGLGLAFSLPMMLCACGGAIMYLLHGAGG